MSNAGPAPGTKQTQGAPGVRHGLMTIAPTNRPVSRRRIKIPEAGPVRAAQYLRMSTEHQRYSTKNQADKIKEYAAEHGIEIVKTYEDYGRSGLDITGRLALQQLLLDVHNGAAAFGTILIYDVSRWGRFQDTDEAAFYEYFCRRAGFQVIYCAEQFANDGSPTASILKTLKRAMAAEFSRELSVKVHAGLCRITSLGFYPGGQPGYGFRRQLIDEHGEPKGILQFMESKNLTEHRVVLVAGPASELRVIKRIYRLFIDNGLSIREIRDRLNASKDRFSRGRPWGSHAVRQILSSERYIGNAIFNRTSLKLKSQKIKNPPESWVRKVGAYPALVPAARFETAGRLLRERYGRFSDDDLLGALRALYKQHGYLSMSLMDSCASLTSSRNYAYRFGNLQSAFALAGYDLSNRRPYLKIKSAIEDIGLQTRCAIEIGVLAVGGSVEVEAGTNWFRINGEFTLSIVTGWSKTIPGQSPFWKAVRNLQWSADMVLFVHTDDAHLKALDYFLIPNWELPRGYLTFKVRNPMEVEQYRCSDLTSVFALAALRRLTASGLT